MSRQESDREDLIRDATGLARRTELRIAGEPALITAGFRDDGRFSLYFGADPVLHFDSQGRLRRAFLDGELYRTQGTTLARLRRVRTPTATRLARHDLDSGELADFLSQVRRRLKTLADAIGAGIVTVARSEPGDFDVPAALALRLPGAQHCRLAPALRR